MPKDVDAKKLTKKFSIDESIKIPVVDIYCEDCLSQERVVAYEADLIKIKFSTPYFECQNCGMILCGRCVSANNVCPDCGNGVLLEVTPKSGHDFCEKMRSL